MRHDLRGREIGHGFSSKLTGKGYTCDITAKHELITLAGALATNDLENIAFGDYRMFIVDKTIAVHRTKSPLLLF